ncbi:MAG: hypothetical protein ACREB8_07595 [Pseudolabrys sp.]
MPAVKNIPWRLTLAAAISVLLLAPAAAQMPIPGINLAPEAKRPLTNEEQEKVKAREDAYKESLKKIPDKQNTKVDPWSNMRATPPASSEAKHRQ